MKAAAWLTASISPIPLTKTLDESTLSIGVVRDVSTGAQIGAAGIYNTATRTITWFAGKTRPGAGGFAEYSVHLKSGLAEGTQVVNYAMVYFPSVPEATVTNSVVSYIPYRLAFNASEGGTIQPSGLLDAAPGSGQTVTVTPIEGYRIKDVKVNGNSVGAVSTYSFIGCNTTIDVSFEPLPVIFVSPAEPPVAVISTPDEFAMAGVPVKLDGTQSYARTEGANLTYEWTLCVLPQNSSAAVAEQVSPLTEFIPDVAGTYQAQLVVNDGFLSSAPVDVIIAVHERDVPPNAVIKSVPPVSVGVDAALNGTESNDPDAWPGPLSYHWDLVTAPQGSLTVIINPDDPTASFVPDVAGDYSVRLTVDDGMFSSEASTTITAVRANVPPVAEAGQK